MPETGGYEMLVAGAPGPQALASVPPLAPFHSSSLEFVEALSARLLRLPQAREHPELVALGYWMRPASLGRLERELRARSAGALLVPRGTAFHIAPSNVDSIFVYSWFLSLLAGNRNIVRLSRRTSVQAELLLGQIGALFARPEHEALAARSLLVRYAPDDRITEELSRACDVRVVWGGDDTVAQVRRIPLPATAAQVAFADKFSLALVDAAAWLAAAEPQRARWAEAFFNDAYWFDQMACSSPRLVLWVGGSETGQKAAADFWPRIERHVAVRNQRFADADYVNKRLAADALSIEARAQVHTGLTNDLVRVWLDRPALHSELHCGAGLFFESALPDLDSLRALLQRRVQTVAYAGFDPARLRDWVAAAPLTGIDRIVPFGRALDFAPVWDGFDLFRVFLREITVA